MKGPSLQPVRDEGSPFSPKPGPSLSERASTGRALRVFVPRRGSSLSLTFLPTALLEL